MSNLNQTDLAIRISKGSSLDANGLYVASDYRFLNELKSAIDILTEAGFDDVEPTIGRYEARENKDVTTYIEISPWHLNVNTTFYDEDGNLSGEEEGGYDIPDFEEHLKLFNNIKALFDPTPHALLASAWDQVATIRIDQEELIFEIGLPDIEEDTNEDD